VRAEVGMPRRPYLRGPGGGGSGGDADGGAVGEGGGGAGAGFFLKPPSLSSGGGIGRHSTTGVRGFPGDQNNRVKVLHHFLKVISTVFPASGFGSGSGGGHRKEAWAGGREGREGRGGGQGGGKERRPPLVEGPGGGRGHVPGIRRGREEGRMGGVAACGRWDGDPARRGSGVLT